MRTTKSHRNAIILAEVILKNWPFEDENAVITTISNLLCDGRKPRWLRPTLRMVLTYFASDRTRPLTRDVAEIIRSSPSFQSSNRKQTIHLERPCNVPSKMAPNIGISNDWHLPPATHINELAKLLELYIDDLNWLLSRNPKNCHYHIKWHHKQNGNTKRLIESPKPLLKETQQIILRKILNQIPLHASACGFRIGTSVLDYVSPHCAQAMVLKMDLKDFFPSISSGRVFRLFMAAGYPESVASHLSDLCTHRIDGDDLPPETDTIHKYLYTRPHLPQGAPTSPAIANLVTYRLDCRLSGLAKSASATYTRYADDLLFSGDLSFQRGIDSFHHKVLTIVIEEGFRIHPLKTRFMKAAQRQYAAGLVLNEKPNLDRRSYDQLKAILSNCIRHGASSQNRDSHPYFSDHLEGRILWVQQSNRKRAEKLWSLYHQIDWTTS